MSIEEYMDHCRKLALNALKPTEKELQHGLELHKEAFVFDAYGFMPLAGDKCPRLDQLIKEKAGRDELKLAYEEHIMNGAYESNPALRKKLAEVWEEAGVDCVFQNSGVEGNSIDGLLKRLSFYTYITDLMPELYERAVFPHQLPGIKERGHKALYMTTNGVPLPERLVSPQEALSHIGVFAKLGVRMMHLTYNRRNLIGDGCAEKSNAGLSDFGRRTGQRSSRMWRTAACRQVMMPLSFPVNLWWQVTPLPGDYPPTTGAKAMRSLKQSKRPAAMWGSVPIPPSCREILPSTPSWTILIMWQRNSVWIMLP